MLYSYDEEHLTTRQVWISIIVTTTAWGIGAIVETLGQLYLELYLIPLDVTQYGWPIYKMFRVVSGLIGLSIFTFELHRRLRTLHYIHVFYIILSWLFMVIMDYPRIGSPYSIFTIFLEDLLQGIVVGLTIGMVLRRAVPSFAWWRIIIVTAGWALAIGLYVPFIWQFPPSVSLICGNPFAGAMVGLIGAFVTFHQIKQALTQLTTSKETSVGDRIPALSDLLNANAAPSTPLTVIEDSAGKPKPKRKPHPMRGLGQYGGYIAVAVVAALVTGAVVIYLTPVREVSVPPMPTMPPFPITPTFPYNDQFNNGRYDFVLNEASGSIPANSRVQLVGGWYDPETSEVWYSIQAQSDFATANARFRQLQYTPDLLVTVMPTATMAFQGEIGMGGFRMVTTEQVGAIPAGARVRISHATMSPSGEWVYVIVAQDETTIAEAFEWQLTYAPGVIPGATPTAGFEAAMRAGGVGVVTAEQVGSIPPGTRVLLGSSYLGADGWVYNVTADNVTYVEAKESQLQFAPDFTPGVPTPTMIPF